MTKDIKQQLLSDGSLAMVDCMNRVANLLSHEVKVVDIVQKLKAEGYTDSEVYLNFVAGRMLFESRKV